MNDLPAIRNYSFVHAEDTQLVTLFNEESINAILQIFSDFSEVSDLKIVKKSEVLRTGDIRNSNLEIETDLALKWTKEPLTILGIFITPDLTGVVDKNTNHVVEKNVQHNKKSGDKENQLCLERL